MRLDAITLSRTVKLFRAFLIAKKLLQGIARRLFAGIGIATFGINAPNHFKPFAVIPQMLVEHRLCPALLALLRRPRVVMRAIQADPQIRAALMARFAAPGLAGE